MKDLALGCAQGLISDVGRGGAQSGSSGVERSQKGSLAIKGKHQNDFPDKIDG